MWFVVFFWREKILLLQQNWEQYLSSLLSHDFTWVLRLDCVLDQLGTPKILEINADYPDGLLMHDATYSVLSWTLTTKNRDMYAKLFSSSDVIFVLYKKWSVFLDAYHTEYLVLQQLWYVCYIWTEEDLEISWGKVTYQWHHITVIRRCMKVGKFSQWLLTALSSTDVKFVNTFDLRVLGYKNLLQTIESPLIPKTLLLTHDLLEFAREHKDNLILKPSNLFEGKWILIGDQCDDSSWTSTLDRVCNDNYVLQEFVDMQKMKVRMYQDGTVIEKELYFDICPHFFVQHWQVVWDGIILMRFSENRILNVAQGGGIGYLKFLTA